MKWDTMQVRKIAVVVLSFALIIAAVSVVEGSKLVVPRDFKSIHAALGEAEEGDTVFVLKGIYYENIALQDNVVLLGEDTHQTIIDGSHKGACIIGANGAVVSHFTITNGSTGILCRNTRPIISDNQIINNKGAGIRAQISLPDIIDNAIINNSWTGIFLESARGTKTTIDHNVVADNGYCGIFCAHTTEVFIHNNMLIGNMQYGLFVTSDARKTRIVNNNFFMNRMQVNTGAVVNETNTWLDPMFIAPHWPTYNYHSKQESQCRGRGENGTDIGLLPDAQ
jgi:nitrous oxidase accessory protein NosD